METYENSIVINAKNMILSQLVLLRKSLRFHKVLHLHKFDDKMYIIFHYANMREKIRENCSYRNKGHIQLSSGEISELMFE